MQTDESFSATASAFSRVVAVALPEQLVQISTRSRTPIRTTFGWRLPHSRRCSDKSMLRRLRRQGAWVAPPKEVAIEAAPVGAKPRTNQDRLAGKLFPALCCKDKKAGIESRRDDDVTSTCPCGISQARERRFSSSIVCRYSPMSTPPLKIGIKCKCYHFMAPNGYYTPL